MDTATVMWNEAVAAPDVWPEVIPRMRSVLDATGFDEPGVCARASIASIHEFTPLSDGRRERRDIGDALDVLIRVFLDSEAVPVAMFEDHVGDTAVFFDAGLLRRSGDGDVEAAVLLYPIGPLRLVSDLRSACRRIGDAGPVADAVYPAITQNTRLFIAGLPTGPCHRLIELCGGTGVGALLGAGDADRAWSADITARSTRFAAFNAALNGIDNVEAVCGDLFEPVAGMTFDRIIAHPPYVAASRQELVFRDGGADGEQVMRRIIEELPAYLEPGGLFYCTCAGTDRKDAPFERRVRAMLGDRHDEFDIVFVETNVHEADRYCADLLVDEDTPREEALHTQAVYRELAVERVLIGSIIMRRHGKAVPALTLRRPMGDTPAAAAADLLLWWERDAAQPEWQSRLLESRPRVAAAASREIAQRNTPAGWVLEACRYSVQTPFSVTLEPSPAAVGFIERCDGTITVLEHLDRLKQEGRFPADVPATAFAEMIRSLAAGGILELGEGWPVPGD